jgi:hypothetical protein
VDRGAQSTSQRAQRAAVRHTARPAGEEIRLAGITTIEQANRFLEITFWPFWDQRFTAPPTRASNAHRRLERTYPLEQILRVREARTVASDHTVRWKGER